MGLQRLDPFLIYFLLIILTLILVFILFKISSRSPRDFIQYSFLLILPLFFILGYYLMKNSSLPHEMDSYFTDEIRGDIIGKVKQVEDKENYQLIILEDARMQIVPSDYLQNANPRSKYQFYSQGLKIYNKSYLDLKVGQSISLEGQIIKFQNATNPGQFDEYNYNKILKYDYKVYCDLVEVIDKDYSYYSNLLNDIRNNLSNVYASSLPAKNSGVLSAMVLGDKANLDADIKDLYKTHGISHILAISGLHVSLIGMTIYKLIRKTGVNIIIAVIISAIFIYSYGALTGFSVSTIRAVIMLILLMFSKIIGRTYDIISAASLSSLIILINNPLQIFSTGFLLSFAAVLGIGLVYPLISSIFPVENKIVKALLDSLFISLSVQIFTLPILLYFFFEISTYSILFNILLVPFVSIIIMLAILGACVGLISLPLGAFFLGGSVYILNSYEWILNIGNKLPFHTLILGRPDSKLILIYYLILFLYIALNYWKVNKYSHFLLIALLIIFIRPRSSNLELTFIDVGQGDGIFFESSRGQTYLVDGGSSSVAEVGKYRIIPFLKSKGISRLDYVFISHFDKDHVNGILEIIEEMDTRRCSGSIYIEKLVLPKYANDTIRNEMNDRMKDISNGARSDGEKDSISDENNELLGLDSKHLTEDEMYKRVISIAKEKGIDIIYMEEGDYIKDGDMAITCLHPIGDFYYFNKNGSSLVLSINYKDFDLLLTGDIEEEGEDILNNILVNRKKDIARMEEDASYDVLKVAHHGSKNSTYNEFLQLTKPRYSIISSGRDNSYGHPHKELLDRLEDVGSHIYISYESGAITIITDGKEMIIGKFLRD